MLTSKKRARLVYLLVPLGIFAVGLIVWQFYKYKMVHRKVDDAITQKSKGLYQLHYEGLRIDEVSGTLHVKNVSIVPDTLIYQEMVREKTNPSVLISIHIPALDILGVKTPKALLQKEIEGRSIEISDPSIEIMLNDTKKDSTLHDPSKDLSKELLGKLLKIAIDSVKIVHAHVLVRKMNSGEALFKGENVSFLLAGLLIDSTVNKDSSRIFFSKNVEVGCEELILPSKDKKYRLQIRDLLFRSRENSLYVGVLKMTPQLGEAEFARSFPVQKDRYDFNLKGISLLHINRGALWRKKLEADSLVIAESSFKIFRDLSYPRDTVVKVGKYPHQQLMHLPVPMNIGKVVVVHSFIEYKEKNAKSDSAGKLQFFNVRATIGHVTNMKEVIARNNECIVSFKASLLNKIPVEARLVLLLKDPRGKFSIEGNLGAFDVVTLNPLTQPMGLARMEKGRIRKLHFDLIASDSSSDGKLLMLYEDLKVSLLKKDKEENKYDKKGLASLLVSVMMKKSNPSKGGEARTVDVHFHRILDKSFFNLIWKSIFTGIKETAGLK